MDIISTNFYYYHAVFILILHIHTRNSNNINAMNKEKEFWNKGKKHYCEYYKKKKEFNKAKNESEKQMLHANLPIKILKPL